MQPVEHRKRSSAALSRLGEQQVIQPSSLPSLIQVLLGMKCSDHNFKEEFDASSLNTTIVKGLKEKSCQIAKLNTD